MHPVLLAPGPLLPVVMMTEGAWGLAALIPSCLVASVLCFIGAGWAVGRLADARLARDAEDDAPAPQTGAQR